MRVLVALDGSEIGERAAQAVSSWAQAAGAEIFLFSIVHPDEVHATAQSPDFVHALTPEGTLSGQIVHSREPMPAPAEDRTQAIDRALAERRDYLNDVARKRLPGVRTVVDVEGSEHTARTIVEQATKIGASFIAMGTHSRSGLAHILMGSVAEAVVRHAEVPVLLVGPNAAVPS